MLFCVVGNMKALHNAAYYYGSSTNFDDDDFKAVGKLQLKVITLWRHQVVNKVEDLVAAILVATYA